MSTVVKLYGARGFTVYTDMVFWATNYCPSFITCDGLYDTEEDSMVYVFYFDDEGDAAMFSVRWL